MDEDNFDSVIDAFANSEPKFVEPVEDPEDEEQETLELPTEEVEETNDAADEEDQGDETGADSDSASDDPDDLEVEIPVDGETRKAKLSELKRLFGQEAALTRKSQAVAEQNRVLEAQGLYLARLYDDRVTQARAQAEKYKGVDLFKAYRELEADEFEALKTAKEAADAELSVVENEAADFVRKAHETKAHYLRQQAAQAIPAIKRAIPDWSDTVYNEVRTYAVAQGMDRQTVNEIVDPAAIILMHKAMQFDAAKAKASNVRQKVITTSKKTVAKGETQADGKSQQLKRLAAKARQSGDVDDVAAAFMAAHAS